MSPYTNQVHTGSGPGGADRVPARWCAPDRGASGPGLQGRRAGADAQGPEPLAPAPGRTDLTHHNGDQLLGPIVEALHPSGSGRGGWGWLGLGDRLGQTSGDLLTEPISKAQLHHIPGNPGGGRR